MGDIGIHVWLCVVDNTLASDLIAHGSYSSYKNINGKVRGYLNMPIVYLSEGPLDPQAP